MQDDAGVSILLFTNFSNSVICKPLFFSNKHLQICLGICLCISSSGYSLAILPATFNWQRCCIFS